MVMDFGQSKKYINRFMLCLLCGFIVSSCSKDIEETGGIEKLRVAVVPVQSEVLLREKYQPLIDYIKLHLDIEVELLVPESYKQLLDWFDEKKVDLARFGGVTYVKAHRKSGAVPVVRKNHDDSSRSVLIVKSGSQIYSLKDLKNKSISYGSRLSTSGHLMPRYYFEQKEIISENYFSSVKYSGAHDLTANWVLNGEVDVGVAKSRIIYEMIKDGRIEDEQLKIIWQSPLYADNVWAVQGYIDDKQRRKIRDAFFMLSQQGAGRKILTKLGVNYYIPAVHMDFVNLEGIVQRIDKEGKADEKK